MEVPEYFKSRLRDLGGSLPDGSPKMRLVFGPDAKRPHGKLAGRPKYLDPNTGRPFEFWVVEQWYPPELCGTRETWPEALLGPYPADCHKECCKGGFFGLRTPVTISGEYLPLSDSVLNLIEGKQMMDIKWSLMSEIERTEAIDAALSASETQADAEAMEDWEKDLDYYATHKEELDNADNRVYSFDQKYGLTGKGMKLPIGRPK